MVLVNEDRQHEPPLQTRYMSLLDEARRMPTALQPAILPGHCAVEVRKLPVIDLSALDCFDPAAAERCKSKIADASSEWGFFQVVNHGIPRALIERVRREQVSLFKQPFEQKSSGQGILGSAAPDSYRWGVPSATRLSQLSWSEAYHLPLAGPRLSDSTALPPVIEEFAVALSSLALRLATVLAERMGQSGDYFRNNCTRRTCNLRLNRYPPCTSSTASPGDPSGGTVINGLVPHTDSDFLTILCQLDQVGGLQVMKDGSWVAVEPNPDALVVNVGDLFEAWSNGEYRSVEHRVVANRKVERYSAAYFLCPGYDTVIESCRRSREGKIVPSIYRRFSFGEFRAKVQEDVRLRGHKVGLSRFRD